MSKVPAKRPFNYLNPYQNLANIQPVSQKARNEDKNEIIEFS